MSEILGIEDLNNKARDFALTIENDGDTYRVWLRPMIITLQRRWIAGDLDLTDGIKATDVMLRRLSPEYYLRFGSAGMGRLSTSERRDVAEYLYRSWVAEWRLGNLTD